MKKCVNFLISKKLEMEDIWFFYIFCLVSGIQENKKNNELINVRLLNLQFESTCLNVVEFDDGC